MNLIAHIDGGARGNPGPAAIGIVIHDDKGNLLYEEGTYIGTATNNEAEYRALIRLLEVVAADFKDSKSLSVRCDSKLIVEQVTGRWKIKEPRLKDLYDELQAKKKDLKVSLKIKHVPREENKEADALVNKALDLKMKVEIVKQNNSDPTEKSF